MMECPDIRAKFTSECGSLIETVRIQWPQNCSVTFPIKSLLIKIYFLTPQSYALFATEFTVSCALQWK